MEMSGLANDIDQQLEKERRGSRDVPVGGVLHLEVGQPSGGAAAKARLAAADAIMNHTLGYTHSNGLPELRGAIAEHYNDWYNVAVDPSDVIVVAGASAGFVLTFLACFDVGDPCYRNTLEALGCEPIGIPVGPDTGYRLTVDAIAKTIADHGPLAGLVIASPSNPTGTILWDEDLAQITNICALNNIQLVADEIYHGISYSTAAPSILSHTSDAIVLNSFSKYFGMTGWRLGWVVAPREVAAAMERFSQNLYICASHVSQVAGLASFECHNELKQNVVDFASKRKALLDGLDACGLTYAPADGAFYAYVDVSHLTDNSWDLSKTWLTELHVATTPGIDFDPVRGHRYVRFSCAGREDHIVEAMRRIKAWIDTSRLKATNT
jgi:aspartate/methionine/tyrosine aminotransferase